MKHQRNDDAEVKSATIFLQMPCMTYLALLMLHTNAMHLFALKGSCAALTMLKHVAIC